MRLSLRGFGGRATARLRSWATARWPSRSSKPISVGSRASSSHALAAPLVATVTRQASRTGPPTLTPFLRSGSDWRCLRAIWNCGGKNGAASVLARYAGRFHCRWSRWVCNACHGLGQPSAQTVGNGRRPRAVSAQFFFRARADATRAADPQRLRRRQVAGAGEDASRAT